MKHRRSALLALGSVLAPAAWAQNAPRRSARIGLVSIGTDPASPLRWQPLRDALRESRPGGNVTGLTSMVPGLSQKYVELLHDTLPAAKGLAVIAAPPNPAPEMRAEIDAAARRLGIAVQYLEFRVPGELDAMLALAKRGGAAASLSPRQPEDRTGHGLDDPAQRAPACRRAHRVRCHPAKGDARRPRRWQTALRGRH